MQLTREQIIEHLKDILRSIDDRDNDLIEKADESMNLVNDFGFSSVNVLFLVIAIEETFNIRFENVSMADFQTLGNVVDYIERKVNELEP